MPMMYGICIEAHLRLLVCVVRKGCGRMIYAMSEKYTSRQAETS
ncbi:hypothetical protein SAMN04488498_1264 [Mesorhizobium albiziae]|uniref:Uncharacterized protein n=1 Tax=Neomesorhizobium albiziae TaxID=335020 RepID=A0A1I4EF22_9HYPH|nr:hypothetical protein SAMN04488498_1264 [Mesorhizobium albiziae]